MKGESLWLIRAQMVKSVQTHLRNISEEGQCEEDLICKESLKTSEAVNETVRKKT